MTISVVQTKTGGTSTTATSLTVTLTSATTAGNCLVVCVSTSKLTSTTASVVNGITLGGSADNFAKAAGANQASGAARCDAEIWTDQNCAGGQTSVVVTVGASQGISVVVYEVSGLAATGAVDASSTNTSGTTGTSFTSGTSGTTVQASEILVGALGVATDGAIGNPAGYTNTSVTSDSGVLSLKAGFDIVSATGTATYNSSITGDSINGGWAAAVVTLKAAGVGISGTAQPLAAVPAPRRRLGRARIQFTPVATVNAAPAAPAAGTIQPAAAMPAPRRRPGRAQVRFTPVATVNAAQPAAGAVQPRATITAPRRRRGRAQVRFTPVATVNATLSRELLISLASAAGTDDYGNSFPQGILATAGVIEGARVVAFGSNGEVLVYSGTPAAGNLVASISGAAGTDQFGNNILSSLVSYGPGSATQIDQGAMSMYTGSLAAGWTAQAQVFISPGGVIELITPAGVITSNNTLDNGAGGATFGGNVTIAGTLSVNGSTSTASHGLTDGTINGTSGAASAGTAHTHGPGSFAVTNGQHAHTL